jgi:hypothetical protein
MEDLKTRVVPYPNKTFTVTRGNEVKVNKIPPVIRINGCI